MVTSLAKDGESSVNNGRKRRGALETKRKDADISVHPTFSVSVIFGKRDEPMLVACARQLIEHISSSGTSQPLVLSLGLKDHSAETLKGIVSAVTENRLW